jgi:hypothetical protein
MILAVEIVASRVASSCAHIDEYDGDDEFAWVLLR